MTPMQSVSQQQKASRSSLGIPNPGGSEFRAKLTVIKMLCDEVKGSTELSGLLWECGIACG